MGGIIAYCGLVCNKCPAFIATRKNDEAGKRKIAEAWSGQFGLEFKSKDINCDGCFSPSDRLSGFCLKICEVRPCARAKKVKNCAHCDQYACEKLETFFARAPEAKNTLDKIRKDIQKIKSQRVCETK